MKSAFRTILKAACVTGAWAVPVCAASAVDFPAGGQAAAWDNLTIALTQADGAVSIALAAEPDAGQLEDLMGLLLMSPAKQVRFSTVYDPETQRVTADQTAILDKVNQFIESHGVEWKVCNDWWMSPDSAVISASVNDSFGGSLILIDNGASSDAYDNPEADFMQARYDDPAFAAVFGDGARRVTDPEEYLAAVEAFWVQVQSDGGSSDGQTSENGGWVDGCR